MGATGQERTTAELGGREGAGPGLAQEGAAVGAWQRSVPSLVSSGKDLAITWVWNG